ncbi:MAG: VOC family protein [Acidimicrobiales bacterium]
MATLGLRHAVLWVTDPAVSARFYEQALGLEAKVETENAVFMTSPRSATDHDLGLFRAAAPAAGERGIGLYHLSWELATLEELAEARERLAAMGALVGENNHGMSRSLYCHDPDGIEFEVMWELPLELYDPDDPSNVALDLEADMARFGADRPGRGATPATGESLDSGSSD